MSSLPAQSPLAQTSKDQSILPGSYHPERPEVGAFLPPHLSLSPFYDLAFYLRGVAGTPCVLDIGPSDASHLASRFNADSVAIVGEAPTLKRSAPFFPKNRLFLRDLSRPLSLPDRLLERSIVVCSNLLNTLEHPQAMIESLQRISQVAPFVIIGTPDKARVEGHDHRGPPSLRHSVQHWGFDEMRTLLRSFNMSVPFSGHVGPWGLTGQKAQSLFLTGTHCLTQKAPKKSVLALVSCYNDIDIIEQCYQHLKSQGISVAFIDNWSSDGTWEKIQTWCETESDACVYAEQFPSQGPSDDYEWAEILKRKTEIGHHLKFDWYIHHDSDEIRESPDPSLTLAEAISRVDALGYSAIDHTVIDFRPTDGSFSGSQSVKDHFLYFEFGSRVDHFMQIKAWKRQPEQINLTSFGGHVAVFPGAKLYPFNFLLRHYSIRSPEHAKKKFFQHRLPRIKKEEANLQWHTHLKQEVDARQEHQFLWDARDLLSYSPGTFSDEYILPRLTGLGIQEENRLKALWHYTQRR